ncbi:MAG: DNA polymerase III subunit epsilon [Pseudohongiellaceae bacterium]
MTRQVVLDTETTGLEWAEGHRIIEVGCVELMDRRLTGRRFQHYLNPDRDIDEGAYSVHGISTEFLADKPRFAQIEEEFIEFVSGAQLIAHNAPFDMGFLDNEISLTASPREDLSSLCQVLDTRVLAAEKHPGQHTNLDALCKRYGVDNTHRELHGALLDAEILAEVYLLMTSGQSSLSLHAEQERAAGHSAIDPNRKPLPVIHASAEEQAAHTARLQTIASRSEQGCLWLDLRLEPELETGQEPELKPGLEAELEPEPEQESAASNIA